MTCSSVNVKRTHLYHPETSNPGLNLFAGMGENFYFQVSELDLPQRRKGPEAYSQ